jgi:uncharacterized membrane protein
VNSTLALFLRLTAAVAIAIVALVVALFLLKIAIIAAVIAAVLVGCFFLYNLFRRSKYPVVR